LTGLVKLLCCSSQQVHCAVVSQMARLAYCTPVLEQVALSLDKYPAAITSVANLLPGNVRAPDSTIRGGALTSSPPLTLQAEAAASLFVLSSLGKGSREVVARTPDVIRGLAEAITHPPVEHYWTAPTPGAGASPPGRADTASSPHQQQPAPILGSRSAAGQPAGRRRLVYTWLLTVLGVTVLQFVGQVAMAPLNMISSTLLLMAPAWVQLAVVCWGMWAPSACTQQHDLQQQWAAYCVYKLLVNHRANIDHVKRDEQTRASLMSACSNAAPSAQRP
jgi:hypothetical protein